MSGHDLPTLGYVITNIILKVNPTSPYDSKVWVIVLAKFLNQRKTPSMT
jgi:hypothetical protein